MQGPGHEQQGIRIRPSISTHLPPTNIGYPAPLSHHREDGMMRAITTNTSSIPASPWAPCFQPMKISRSILIPFAPIFRNQATNCLTSLTRSSSTCAGCLRCRIQMMAEYTTNSPTLPLMVWLCPASPHCRVTPCKNPLPPHSISLQCWHNLRVSLKTFLPNSPVLVIHAFKPPPKHGNGRYNIPTSCMTRMR